MPPPATPKITLEFQLKPFKLVRSCFEPPNAAPLRMSNHPERDPSKEAYLDWDGSSVPEALAAYVFAFVRVRRFSVDVEKRNIDESWRVLIGRNGSAAFKVGGVYTQTNAASYKWIREFCGSVSRGNRSSGALNAFIRAPGYKGGRNKEVTVLFDATMFPPANVSIKVCGKVDSPNATPNQLLQIERALCSLKVWGSPDALCKHIPKSLPESGGGAKAKMPPQDRHPRLDPKTFLDYRRHIARQFGDVQDASLRFLSAAGAADGEVKPPRLAEVYVKLDTEPGSERQRERVDVEKEPARVPAIKRLIDLVADRDSRGARSWNLVLLGGPGSGKSTFLKHVCLALAQHALAPRGGWLGRLDSRLPTDKADTAVFSWPKEKGALVPVFVELRKFADELAQSPPKSTDADGERLWAFIADELAGGDMRHLVPDLKEAVARGNALVFFDGLDEVPTEALKRFMVNTVAQFATIHSSSAVVVTCRIVSYADETWHLPGFATATLSTLNAPRRRLFIERFYSELAARGRSEAAGRVASLTQSVETRAELRDMAGTPYLLSMMCQLHLRTKLPGERAALFEKFVAELLFDLEASKRRGAKGPPAPNLKDILDRGDVGLNSFRGALCRLAFLAHRAGQREPNGGAGPAAGVIAEQDLKDELAKLPHKRFSKTEREDWATEIIRLIETRSGLLEARTPHQFAMAFKLQEFMAATHLTLRGELAVTHGEDAVFETIAAELIEDDGGYWEEVVKLAAGIQAHVRDNPLAACELASTLCEHPSHSDATRVRRAKIAAEILSDIGINDVEKHSLGRKSLVTVRKTLREMAADPRLPAPKRSEAASAFGCLEDLPEGGIAETEPRRPRFLWCGADGVFDGRADAAVWKRKLFPARKTPKTAFLIGDPAKRSERAYGSFIQFPCTRIAEPFFVGKYPVTVAQYQAFVDAVGYGKEEFWTEAGRAWRAANDITGPQDYSPVYQTPNHPRVGVSWHEARACCAWLDSTEIKAQLLRDAGLPEPGWTIRLPSEAEWELAARWNAQQKNADDRLFPWGDEDEDRDLSDRCNWDGAGIGHTSAVGIFPKGNAGCGAADMAGNLWEWCRTKWVAMKDGSDDKKRDEFTPERYNEMNNGIDNEDGEDSRVLRGGSWINSDPRNLRAADRRYDDPGVRYDNFGFRVVCVLVGSARG